MNTVTIDRTESAVVASLRDERGGVAVAMLLDGAPEGGVFREPVAVPLSLAQRFALEFIGWLPYAVVLGTFGVLFALALRASH